MTPGSPTEDDHGSEGAEAGGVGAQTLRQRERGPNMKESGKRDKTRKRGGNGGEEESNNDQVGREAQGQPSSYQKDQGTQKRLPSPNE